MKTKHVVKEVAIWIVTVLLILMFGNAGIRKFFELGGWTRMFHNLGLPDWFRVVIGVLETAAALLLALPRTAAYGAALIVTIMLGALGEVVMHGWTRAFMQPIVAMALAAIVLIARWRQRAAIHRVGAIVPS